MCADQDWQAAIAALREAPDSLERALGPVYFARVRHLMEDAEHARHLAAAGMSPVERELAGYSFQRRAEQAIALMDEIATEGT